ncbi:MAG: pantoate--beta-alanine ligase [Verrucomicrobia bacterium A1]|nr:MAG: pantoate--beta-alanine ligase [Verrucomicrobia bacterium A1]
MKIIRSPAEMQTTALALRRDGRRIGLVPTMGYLHEGHLSLIRIARPHAEVVVVSIFVNPTQFGPNEDLGKYPRDFERDERLCREAGADIVFYPSAADMYPADHSVFVVEERLSRGLCGAARPGHFRGVCTVVAKLFNLVLPDSAVFGEKDGQQLRIIERMVRDLDFSVRIVRGPTVREPDGLAMSSRNVFLAPEERRQALCLRKALDRTEAMHRDGERDAEKVRKALREVIAEAPLARIDYVEIVDDVTLEPVQTLDRPSLVALAVFVGKTRLIDNTVIGAGA